MDLARARETVSIDIREALDRFWNLLNETEVHKVAAVVRVEALDAGGRPNVVACSADHHASALGETLNPGGLR